MEAGRRKVLVASIMEIQVSYVRKSRRSEVVYVLTIGQKGLGQKFEEGRRGRPADVFNIFLFCFCFVFVLSLELWD